VRRGGRVFAQPVKDGEWLTIGDPINYLKTLIEYALDDQEIRAALEPRIRKILE
jgi:UTP-glucose-1-phosphate uridylyltransferase